MSETGYIYPTGEMRGNRTKSHEIGEIVDLLTRDALILITAKAASKAQMTPTDFLNRYFKDEKERSEAEGFLYLMELAYTGYEEISTWDPEWSLDNRRRRVVKWWDED